MKIGAVKYLNALPLTYYLGQDLFYGTPAQLAEGLLRGELDLALAPVVALFDNPEWHRVGDYGIATRSAVKSVLIKVPSQDFDLSNIKEINSGNESKTSVILLKVLLKIKYGRDLSQIRFSQNPGAPCSLLIGDEALRCALGGEPVIDLGLEWTSWTGLPFVFAAWMSRHKEIPPEWSQRFKKAHDLGLENIDLLLKEETKFPKPFLKKYLTENISYDLGPKEKEGMALFQKYAALLFNMPQKLNKF